MKNIAVHTLLVAVLLAAGCAANDSARDDESIRISEAGDRYTLTVPVSQLTMTMPRRSWARKAKSIGGGTSSPRYFYFEDTREASLIMSGWFEPDRQFRGVRQHWDQDTRAWRQRGLPEPVNVSFARLGRWETVSYDYRVGKATSSHIRAHWVQSGTWIDVHLSTTTYGTSAENRKKLKALLSDIAVTEK